MSTASLRRAAGAWPNLVLAACSLAIAVGPACAPPVDAPAEDQPENSSPALHPLNLAVWDGTPQDGSPVSGTTDTPDTTPPSGDTGTSNTQQPTLVLSEAQLSFDAKTIQRMFAVSQSGAGSLTYTVASDVPWAAANPTSGTTAEGMSDAIDVTVDVAQLSSGEHNGNLTVRTDGGEAREVGMRVLIDPPPELEVSPMSLPFGPGETTLVLTLRNAGSGELAYQVASDADWVTATPPDGQLSGAPLAVEVTIRRTPLVIGEHQAHLTVQAGNGQTATVLVQAAKSVTSPRVMPWLDLNVRLEEHVAICRAGLDQWQYVTNAVVLQAGREYAFYRNMRALYPSLEIVPAIHTSYAVRLPDFASLTGWQTIAADVRKMAEACGTNRVLLDNEIALVGYNEAIYDIDLDQLRVALSYMPRDIQILWYPSIYPDRLPNQPDALARTTALCQTVNAALNVRIVDLSYGSSQYWAPICGNMRQTLEAFASQPTLPIAWFGCSLTYCWWQYDELPQVMQVLSGRPDVLFYPLHGTDEWVQMADALVPQLQQP